MVICEFVVMATNVEPLEIILHRPFLLKIRYILFSCYNVCILGFVIKDCIRSCLKWLLSMYIGILNR
ncbi:hypothetical protein HanPSC8_Chr00c752g0809591 [Helianthus annuus]|nr:hypothetical protein HanPSC8_Chr00c752g0809591 [Helianthus annuus]